MTAIRATFRRVTIRTKPPYLARVNGYGKRDKDPMIVMVQSVENPGRNGPPFGRALILSSPSKYPDFAVGSTVCIDNFRCLSRIELDGIPHSDAKP